jgi:hypothetical protein
MRAALIAAAAAASGGVASAQNPTERSEDGQAETDTVLIWGRASDLTGEAQSASEGVVGYADFETRPLLRPGELVEVIPGMLATQHSGGGKSNQYFLRGFNLDHGSDFHGSIDGVPLNLRSHPHMSGYLDINFIIPELIRTVAYRKGVHSADAGDYSAAGSARFSTYDRLEAGFFQTDLTERGERRVLLADSLAVADGGDLLYGVQFETGDGPFEVPENLQKSSALLKLTRPVGAYMLSAALMTYDNRWTATDQIPLRAIASGQVSLFGSLDPTLGGETERVIAQATLTSDTDLAQIYAQTYSLDLYGNPTFFLDAVNGDQFLQRDRRWSAGARWTRTLSATVGGIPTTLRGGLAAHSDQIRESGLYRTKARALLSPVRSDRVEVRSIEAWGEMTLHWTDRLRTTAGLRADRLDYDVRALQPENSGRDGDVQISPKASLAYAVSPDLEAYLGAGIGFHSNDARGVALRTDPVTGDPVEPADLFVAGRGGEAGFRYHPSNAFNLTANVFHLELDSEMVFVGDAGTSEPSAGTRRYGLELAGFWDIGLGVVLDGSAAWSHARFKDVPDGADRVPNSVAFVGSAGATWVGPDQWLASVRMRHMGEAALTEDGSQRSEPTTIVNLGLSKAIGRFEIGLDVLNALDSRDADITYFYESRLAGEPAPVADIHLHPVHPRTLRLTARVRL